MLAKRLVLATGYFNHPNRMGVPGEDLPHVRHYFDEPHTGYGQDVVVIGGRNSAVEAALDLYRAGARVTLVYRGTVFPASVKYWLKPDIENRIKAGEIAARLGAIVRAITPQAVSIQRADRPLSSFPPSGSTPSPDFIPIWISSGAQASKLTPFPDGPASILTP